MRETGEDEGDAATRRLRKYLWNVCLMKMLIRAMTISQCCVCCCWSRIVHVGRMSQKAKLDNLTFYFSCRFLHFTSHRNDVETSWFAHQKKQQQKNQQKNNQKHASNGIHAATRTDKVTIVSSILDQPHTTFIIAAKMKQTHFGREKKQPKETVIWTAPTE